MVGEGGSLIPFLPWQTGTSMTDDSGRRNRVTVRIHPDRQETGRKEQERVCPLLLDYTAGRAGLPALEEEIDVILSCRLFRHLFSLLLRYFETRRVGDT